MTDFKVNKELEDNTAFKERFVDAIRTFLDVEPPIEYVDEWIHGNPPDSYFHLQEWVINQERFPLWAQGISFLEAMWGMADDPCDGRGHTTKDCMENKNEKWKDRSDKSYKIGDVLDLNICGTIGNNIIIGKETNRIKNMMGIDDMVFISQWRYASGK